MQKKILLLITVMAVFGFSATAQIKKGATLLGGQIGFSTGKTENVLVTSPMMKSTAFNFSPAFGKAVKDNLVMGVDLGFGYSKYQNYNPQYQKNISYGLGFFVRQYKELGKGFYLFGQGRVGGYYSRQESCDANGATQIVKGYGARVAFYPGIAYSATKKLQLEAGFNDLAFVQFDHSSSPGSSGNNFSLGTSLSSGTAGITVGFRVLLN